MFQNQSGFSCLLVCAMNSSRFTSGATPADLLVASMAAEPLVHVLAHIQALMGPVGLYLTFEIRKCGCTSDCENDCHKIIWGNYTLFYIIQMLVKERICVLRSISAGC